MYKNKNFVRIMFMLILACISGMGAALYQNWIMGNYPWIIGDVIILILLFVDAYLYAKEIK